MHGAGERGQSTVEWIGLLLLAGLLVAILALAAASRLAGIGVAEAIAERLVCAVRLSPDCGADERLERASGEDLAALYQAHAPNLIYEEGMGALPVDFRRCRADGCAEGPGAGAVARTHAGDPVVAFTHAIDCRHGAIAATVASGADCSGERRGNLYLQYWFYYPGSATAEGSTPLRGPIRAASAAVGRPSYHPDDWESYQVRIGRAGTFARASSHHGYSYELGGWTLIPGHRLRERRDGRVRIRPAPEVVNGWGPAVRTLYVSGGSHAGNARASRKAARVTKGHRLKLIPLRWIAIHTRASFAVTPPWEKRVYRDPEYWGTD